MILSNISFSDIVVFLIFLAPQLLFTIRTDTLLITILYALPHLLLLIPFQLIKERYFTPFQSRSPYVQRATLFQDVVIRCVRYAFANMPASIGAVFFSKPVALPFMRWRMLRHGYFRSPIHYQEVLIDVVEDFKVPATTSKQLTKRKQVRGVWIIADKSKAPDVCVYYLHGGGFSMGSCYFYLEFLLAWLHLLRVHRRKTFTNPAVLALDYTLVPEETYPRQLWEVVSAYRWLLNKARQTSGEPLKSVAQRVCISGDSAGSTLSLSLLLKLATSNSNPTSEVPPPPAFATLISPWPTLVSHLHAQTTSDYLNTTSLHLYARQYIGDVSATGQETNPLLDIRTLRTKNESSYLTDPIASPGTCKDATAWRKAWPSHGWHWIFGQEETLGEDARALLRFLKEDVKQMNGKGDTTVTEQEQQVHAWPVVQLFLGEGEEERLGGLRRIVDVMVDAMSEGTKHNGLINGRGSREQSAETRQRWKRVDEL